MNFEWAMLPARLFRPWANDLWSIYLEQLLHEVSSGAMLSMDLHHIMTHTSQHELSSQQRQTLRDPGHRRPHTPSAAFTGPFALEDKRSSPVACL